MAKKISSDATPHVPQEPKRHRLAGTVIHDARIPVTTLKQKYVSPPSRHSQVSHAQAQARGAALGHTTERELHESDRTATSDGIAEVARVKKAQQLNNPK